MPDVTEDRHRELAAFARQLMATYRDAEDLIANVGASHDLCVAAKHGHV